MITKTITKGHYFRTHSSDSRKVPSLSVGGIGSPHVARTRAFAWPGRPVLIDEGNGPGHGWPGTPGSPF
jgi:hypothetical protein